MLQNCTVIGVHGCLTCMSTKYHEREDISRYSKQNLKYIFESNSQLLVIFNWFALCNSTCQDVGILWKWSLLYMFKQINKFLYLFKFVFSGGFVWQWIHVHYEHYNLRLPPSPLKVLDLLLMRVCWYGHILSEFNVLIELNKIWISNHGSGLFVSLFDNFPALPSGLCFEDLKILTRFAVVVYEIY